MIEVTLPLRIVSEANSRGSWHAGAKRAKEQRSATMMSLLVKTKRFIATEPLPAVVTLTRIGPRALDGDNLQRALKAVRDGVADALGVDDGDARLEWRYEQSCIQFMGESYYVANKYGVRIRIEAKP